MPIAEVLSTNVLHRHRIFAIIEQSPRLASGRTVVHHLAHHPGAVVIMPQLEDGRLLVIAQYRFAVGETLLKFPAGTLEPGEAPLECARRELIEETGTGLSTGVPYGPSTLCQVSMTSGNTSFWPLVWCPSTPRGMTTRSSR